MSKWPKTRFADICKNSAFGPRFSGELYAANGNVATLRTTDIREDGRIEYRTMPLASLDLSNLQQHILREDDLVITRSGRVGTTAIFEEFRLPVLPGAFLIRFRLKREIADPLFYRYYFNSPEGRDLVISTATGSVQQNLNITSLHLLDVPIPPLPTQHAIARILGSLDDKIELNRQMNETLEAMARAIFQSWFVDFDPVRAKAEGDDTGLPMEIAVLFPDGFEGIDGQEVPKGWGVGKISDLGEIVCGKTPPTKNPENYGNDMLFITIPDMHNQIFILNTSRMLSSTGVQTQSNKTLPPMSICVSCIASPGLISLTSKASQTNQQINSIVPLNKKNAFYCYYALKGLASEIISSGSGGSVIYNLNKGEFSSIAVLLPPYRIIEKYHDMVDSLFMKILTNQEEICTLALIRDALLPKLMSGEIKVNID
ncbi:MAG: restriction endonuclease subunit S [Methanoregula sp.]|nr:restriction endonuclease subunit S [Methanoregula sp.]